MSSGNTSAKNFNGNLFLLFRYTCVWLTSFRNISVFIANTITFDSCYKIFRRIAFTTPLPRYES